MAEWNISYAVTDHPRMAQHVIDGDADLTLLLEHFADEILGLEGDGSPLLGG